MPMKRSGRSVEAASRVIEIDEVLVPTMVVGLECRAERGEDLALDLFFLGRRLDHQIAVAEVLQRFCRADALERSLALLVGDALAADLTRQVAADGGEPFGNALGDNVVEQHVQAGQRADMRDAVAHLTGADHADLADGMAVPPLWSPRVFGRSFTSTIFAYLLRGHAATLRPPVNDRAFPAPGPAPARPDRGPPPVHSRQLERSALPRPC